MKRQIKIVTLLFAAMLFFTQCEKEQVSEPATIGTEFSNTKEGESNGEGCGVVQTLWAGAGQNDTLNGTNVGHVTAMLEGDYLHVTYDVEFPWVLTEAHLWVGNDLNDVPRNAAPGRFPYKAIVDYEGSVSFDIDLANRGIYPGDNIYVAAHGVVVGLEGDVAFETLLPDDVAYSVIYFKDFADNGIPTPAQSYFQIDVIDGFLAGSHKGWCVDTSTPVTQEELLNGIAYSSFGDFPVDLFDKPENLPAVNWVINTIVVGEESDEGFGAYTMGDIQRAIWILLEDEPNLNVPGGVGSSSADRVNEIVANALELGADFVPECDELVAIIMVSPNEQTTIIEFPFPCGGGSETIWGFGENTFIDNNIAQKWGWVFEVDCYADDENDNGEDNGDNDNNGNHGNGNGNNGNGPGNHGNGNGPGKKR